MASSSAAAEGHLLSGEQVLSHVAASVYCTVVLRAVTFVARALLQQRDQTVVTLVMVPSCGMNERTIRSGSNGVCEQHLRCCRAGVPAVCRSLTWHGLHQRRLGRQAGTANICTLISVLQVAAADRRRMRHGGMAWVSGPALKAVPVLTTLVPST
jgi:hypothetical protein